MRTAARPVSGRVRQRSRAASESVRQARYFDEAGNQYPRRSVVAPPLHTSVELSRVRAALNGVAAPGESIIDFGCGTGRLAVFLARSGYDVLGVDVSTASTAALAEVGRTLRLPVRTATRLPRGERFRAVVGADVLHHVEMDVYLPRIRECLQDGGKAVFSEPGGLNPAWYVFLPLSHDVTIERGIVGCNLISLRRRFERHGFRRVEITGVGLLPRPLFGRWRRVCELHDRLGDLPPLRAFAYRYLIEAWR